MERYFMSIEEAVELVLLSATLPQSLYVLDMGAPLKIERLAREMIRLAGKVPDDEIAVEITGLRPGERMSESLIGAGEKMAPTEIPGIFEVVSEKA
jgi:O-antigen biosynthesis protein WbqV